MLDFGLLAYRSLLLHIISTKNCSRRRFYLLLLDFPLVYAAEQVQRATVFFPVTVSVSFCTTELLFFEKKAKKITSAQGPTQMEKTFFQSYCTNRGILMCYLSSSSLLSDALFIQSSSNYFHVLKTRKVLSSNNRK